MLTLTFPGDTGSPKNITYDDNGNMTSVTTSCGTTTYSWDVRNRLVGINGFTLTSTSPCSSVVASFSYDALGRRISKTINGVTTQYLYDGLDIVQEKQNGVVTANYIRTLNIDEPLVRFTPNSIRFYQQDALGSVIALTDQTGTVTTRYSYDPFGNTTVTGETSDNPFQYTGRENDGTGLHYYRARYYSPELQRFISEDPIGIRGGINMFVYVNNQPMSYRDPLGLIKGCGPGRDWGFGDIVIPDYPVGLPFIGCCDQHDKCYECQKGKDKCDIQFCFCLIRKCASGYRSLLPMPVPDCWTISLVYCRAVRDFGDEAYKKARVNQ